MTRSIKYIVSLGLMLFAINASAQDSLRVEVKDSLTLQTDTLGFEMPNSPSMEAADTTTLPKSVQKHFSILIGADYGKLITTAAQFDTRYEFNLGIQFTKRLRVTVDYGNGKLAPSNAIENGTYTSTGNYYRAGLDYIFTLAPKTFLSLGGMYAISTFKDEATVEIQSEIWPSLSETFARNDFTANWAEFVLTSEAALVNKNEGFFSNLYWGIKFRLRFMIDRPAPENLDVYAIPGYGRTWNNVAPAANLFIVYKL